MFVKGLVKLRLALSLRHAISTVNTFLVSTNQHIFSTSKDDAIEDNLYF